MSSRWYWTGAMTNAVLEHLEENKGDTGSYMTNRKAALESGATYIGEKCPSHSVTPDQVFNKLSKLWWTHRRHGLSRFTSLFVEGRRVLKSVCDRDALLEGDNKCGARNLKPRRRYKTAGRQKQPRASSTAKYRSTHVQDDQKRYVFTPALLLWSVEVLTSPSEIRLAVRIRQTE